MLEGTTGEIDRQLAESFAAHRGALLKIIARHLPSAMLKRFTPEDVLGETWVQCARRVVYFTEHPDVPVSFKFRTVLLQTITDLALALGIAVSAASRHYTAALERLRVKLLELSEFR